MKVKSAKLDRKIKTRQDTLTPFKPDYQQQHHQHHYLPSLLVKPGPSHLLQARSQLCSHTDQLLVFRAQTLKLQENLSLENLAIYTEIVREIVIVNYGKLNTANDTTVFSIFL